VLQAGVSQYIAVHNTVQLATKKTKESIQAKSMSVKGCDEEVGGEVGLAI